MTFRRTLFAHLPNFCHPDFFPGCWRNCFPCGSAQVSSFIMHQMGDSRSRIIFCAIILFLGRLNWPVCSTLNASGSCLLQRSSLLQSGWFQGVEQPKFRWHRSRKFGFSRQCPNMCQAANRRWGARARAGCRCSPSQCSTMQGLPLRPSTFPPSQPNPIQTQSVCYSQKSLCAIHYFYRTQVSLGSDLWVRFSLTELPFADLTDVTLANEDANSILMIISIGHSKAMWQCECHNLVGKL